MTGKVELSAMLSGIHFMIGRTINKVFNEDGDNSLSVSRYRIMLALLEDEGITAQKLCEKTALAKSTLSIMTSYMESDGIISRETSEKDRREVSLKLTDKGKELCKEYLERAEKAISGIYDGINSENIQIFEDTVMSVYKNLMESTDSKRLSASTYR